MANNTYKTRVQMKNDTAANWAKAVNFIPLKGEIIIYSDLNQLKVGDGTTKVNALPFIASSGSASEGGTDEVYVGDTQPTGGQEIWIDTTDDGRFDEDGEEYALKSDLSNYQLVADAFSGSYDDLTNKPNTVAISTSISAASGNANAVSPKAVYDYVQTAITSLPTVYTGDTTPDSTFGNVGDLYLVVEG